MWIHSVTVTSSRLGICVRLGVVSGPSVEAIGDRSAAGAARRGIVEVWRGARLRVSPQEFDATDFESPTGGRVLLLGENTAGDFLDGRRIYVASV